jgi:hypothetical protein
VNVREGVPDRPTASTVARHLLSLSLPVNRSSSSSSSSSLSSLFLCSEANVAALRGELQSLGIKCEAMERSADSAKQVRQGRMSEPSIGKVRTEGGVSGRGGQVGARLCGGRANRNRGWISGRGTHPIRPYTLHTHPRPPIYPSIHPFTSIASPFLLPHPQAAAASDEKLRQAHELTQRELDAARSDLSRLRSEMEASTAASDAERAEIAARLGAAVEEAERMRAQQEEAGRVLRAEMEEVERGLRRQLEQAVEEAERTQGQQEEAGKALKAEMEEVERGLRQQLGAALEEAERMCGQLREAAEEAERARGQLREAEEEAERARGQLEAASRRSGVRVEAGVQAQVGVLIERALLLDAFLLHRKPRKLSNIPASLFLSLMSIHPPASPQDDDQVRLVSALREEAAKALTREAQAKEALEKVSEALQQVT